MAENSNKVFEVFVNFGSGEWGYGIYDGDELVEKVVGFDDYEDAYADAILRYAWAGEK